MNRIQQLRQEISELEKQKEKSNSKKNRLAISGAIRLLKEKINNLRINP